LRRRSVWPLIRPAPSLRRALPYETRRRSLNTFALLCYVNSTVAKSRRACVTNMAMEVWEKWSSADRLFNFRIPLRGRFIWRMLYPGDNAIGFF